LFTAYTAYLESESAPKMDTQRVDVNFFAVLVHLDVFQG
jgi:hypothetical protein